MPKEKLPAGIIVRVQQKGWKDKGLLQNWVHMVWSRRPDVTVTVIYSGLFYSVGGLSRRQSMLVLDVFSCHKTNDTKALLRQTNTDLVIIRGRITSLLQPLCVQQAVQGRATSLLVRLDN